MLFQSTDLTGQKFGMLLVLSNAPSKGKNLYVNCICDCGKKTVVQKGHLGNGHTKSCGCLNYTHKMRDTPEYKAWSSMRGRCYKEYVFSYPIYGGRGITVCERWLNSFENFFADMGERPSKSHSLDRVDTNGNYEPGNCRWATPHEQTRNQRTNRWIEYNGEKLILSDWAIKFKVTSAAIFRMIKNKGVEETIKYYYKKTF